MMDFFGKSSNAKPKHGWATGYYSCTCRHCGDRYQGQKRSYECADCAYDESIYRGLPTEAQLIEANKLIKEIFDKGR